MADTEKIRLFLELTGPGVKKLDKLTSAGLKVKTNLVLNKSGGFKTIENLKTKGLNIKTRFNLVGKEARLIENLKKGLTLKLNTTSKGKNDESLIKFLQKGIAQLNTTIKLNRSKGGDAAKIEKWMSGITIPVRFKLTGPEAKKVENLQTKGIKAAQSKKPSGADPNPGLTKALASQKALNAEQVKFFDDLFTKEQSRLNSIEAQRRRNAKDFARSQVAAARQARSSQVGGERLRRSVFRGGVREERAREEFLSSSVFTPEDEAIREAAFRQNLLPRDLAGLKGQRKLFDKRRFNRPGVKESLAFSFLFGGPTELAGGLIGGGISGSVAGVTLGAAGAAAVFGSLGAALESTTAAGLEFQRSIVAISATLQSISTVSGPGGSPLPLGQQIRAQEARARRIQLEARGRLLPLGVAGAEEAAIVSAVTLGGGSKNLDLTESQIARLSEGFGAAKQIFTPDIPAARLRRDISDIVLGLPQAGRTTLGAPIPGIVEAFKGARTSEDIEDIIRQFGALGEAIRESDQAATQWARVVGNFSGILAQIGDQLLQDIQPALKATANILGDILNLLQEGPKNQTLAGTARAAALGGAGGVTGRFFGDLFQERKAAPSGTTVTANPLRAVEGSSEAIQAIIDEDLKKLTKSLDAVPSFDRTSKLSKEVEGLASLYSKAALEMDKLTSAFKNVKPEDLKKATRILEETTNNFNKLKTRLKELVVEGITNDLSKLSARLSPGFLGDTARVRLSSIEQFTRLTASGVPFEEAKTIAAGNDARQQIGLEIGAESTLASAEDQLIGFDRALEDNISSIKQASLSLKALDDNLSQANRALSNFALDSQLRSQGDVGNLIANFRQLGEASRESGQLFPSLELQRQASEILDKRGFDSGIIADLFNPERGNTALNRFNLDFAENQTRAAIRQIDQRPQIEQEARRAVARQKSTQLFQGENSQRQLNRAVEDGLRLLESQQRSQDALSLGLFQQFAGTELGNRLAPQAAQALADISERNKARGLPGLSDPETLISNIGDQANLQNKVINTEIPSKMDEIIRILSKGLGVAALEKGFEARDAKTIKDENKKQEQESDSFKAEQKDLPLEDPGSNKLPPASSLFGSKGILPPKGLKILISTDIFGDKLFPENNNEFSIDGGNNFNLDAFGGSLLPRVGSPESAGVGFGGNIPSLSSPGVRKQFLTDEQAAAQGIAGINKRQFGAGIAASLLGEDANKIKTFNESAGSAGLAEGIFAGLLDGGNNQNKTAKAEVPESSITKLGSAVADAFTKALNTHFAGN